MVGVREEIDETKRCDFIPLPHLLEVPRKGRRVAGEIDDPFAPQFHELPQTFRSQSRTGRIDDDDIVAGFFEEFRRFSVLPPSEAVLHRHIEKIAVLDAVEGGAPPAVFNGVAVFLNRDDLSCSSAQGQRKISRPGIEIKDCLSLQGGERISHDLHDGTVQGPMGLEKTPGGDRIFQSVQIEDDIVFSERNAVLEGNPRYSEIEDLLCGSVRNLPFHEGCYGVSLDNMDLSDSFQVDGLQFPQNAVYCVRRDEAFI